MRLIHIETLTLQDFIGDAPPYAILSHTWGDGEVTFQDFGRPGADEKPGWRKITGFCDTVSRLLPDVEHAWVDTCCIDKTSSAELSEAINAMFAWYRDAVVCYAYLADVRQGDSTPIDAQFEGSRWFTRGWTLQELLAPSSVEFFDEGWSYIGNRLSLAGTISRVTLIEEEILTLGEWKTVSAARKMSWAASRQTTRSEDMAYCLLGIFGVNMPMLYGEGEGAFIRLQEEILRESDDHSILAWDASSVPQSVTAIGALATDPSVFKNCAAVECHPSSGDPLAITNRGLQLHLPIMEQSANPGQQFGVLSCISRGDAASAIAISLLRSNEDRTKYTRTRAQAVRLPMRASVLKGEKVFLMKRHQESKTAGRVTKCWVQYTGSSCDVIGEYPSAYWQVSASTSSTTMTIPPSMEDEARGIVAFKVPGSEDCFTVALLLRPGDGTGRVDVASSPDLLTCMDPVEDECARQLQGRPGDVQKLRLSTVKVAVDMKLQIVRGSRMNVVVVNCVSLGESSRKNTRLGR